MWPPALLAAPALKSPNSHSHYTKGASASRITGTDGALAGWAEQRRQRRRRRRPAPMPNFSYACSHVPVCPTAAAVTNVLVIAAPERPHSQRASFWRPAQDSACKQAWHGQHGSTPDLQVGSGTGRWPLLRETAAQPSNGSIAAPPSKPTATGQTAVLLWDSHPETTLPRQPSLQKAPPSHIIKFATPTKPARAL
jgi:hypothetical protein